MGVYIQSEVHMRNGRSDALVVLDEGVFCLEFKLDKSAQEAINQIKDKGYLDQFTEKPCFAIGINFLSNERKVQEIILEAL